MKILDRTLAIKVIQYWDNNYKEAEETKIAQYIIRVFVILLNIKRNIVRKIITDILQLKYEKFSINSHL